MHVLGHIEVEGISSVAAEEITVDPIEASEIGIGFVDETFREELDAVHEDTKTPGKVQCTECRLCISEDQVAKHYRDVSKSGGDECETCLMVMPNPCSLSAHQRIHEKAPPFVCPECSATFDTW